MLLCETRTKQTYCASSRKDRYSIAHQDSTAWVQCSARVESASIANILKQFIPLYAVPTHSLIQYMVTNAVDDDGRQHTLALQHSTLQQWAECH